VDKPTIVNNKATITYDDASLERHALVLVVPTPMGQSNLRGSHKIASKHYVASGDALTYTIRLHNSGIVSATADVTDPLPSLMSYVVGSATGGGIYDPDTGTLTWSDVTVPPGDSVSLSFVVTATAVDKPTLVINKVTIAADEDAFERQAPVLIMAKPEDRDAHPPIVHNLTIGDNDVLKSPTVTLHISATDNVSVKQMYIQEWQLVTEHHPHWEVVQTSGWVPYQAEYTWTLKAESGTHFVGVWVADAAHNRSHLTKDALDYASLLLAGETVNTGEQVPYLVHYEKGVNVSAMLTPTTGDSDLYVWYPGSFGLPDEKSTKPGTAPDAVSFETPREGTYLFLVYGYEASTYDLSITPEGGVAKESITSQALSTKPDVESPLLQSGLDPLGIATEPPGTHIIYLPMISR
jgi:uncharacterized repeat protein (TIGR01451 family)